MAVMFDPNYYYPEEYVIRPRTLHLQKFKTFVPFVIDNEYHDEQIVNVSISPHSDSIDPGVTYSANITGITIEGIFLDTFPGYIIKWIHSNINEPEIQREHYLNPETENWEHIDQSKWNHVHVVSKISDVPPGEKIYAIIPGTPQMHRHYFYDVIVETKHTGGSITKTYELLFIHRVDRNIFTMQYALRNYMGVPTSDEHIKPQNIALTDYDNFTYEMQFQNSLNKAVTFIFD